jgi:hypothetical protein
LKTPFTAIKTSRSAVVIAAVVISFLIDHCNAEAGYVVPVGGGDVGGGEVGVEVVGKNPEISM